MSYKPKFKEKELKQIARKCLSTDFCKWEQEPVKFEWKPKLGLVKLHFEFDDDPNIDKGRTWTLCVPIRPFEIGYKQYIIEVQNV